MKTFYRMLLLSTCIGLLTPLLTACSTSSSPSKTAIEHRQELFQKLKPNLSKPLVGRVQRMPDELLAATQAFDKSINIANSGRYQARAATDDELALIKSYIALLPSAHQAVFAEKLLAIYLIDNFSGAGLTDWVVDDEGRVYYYIAFNSALLSTPLDHWLSYKEDSPFDDSATSPTIRVQTHTHYKALLHGLLHEGAHVVDYERGITPYVDTLHKQFKHLNRESSAFTTNVWVNKNTPKTEFDFSHRGKYNLYRIFSNMALIPRAEMPGLFAQLKKTPFVGFYSGSTWSEHLADYLAYYHIEKKLDGSITLNFLSQGSVVDSYDPLKALSAQRLEKAIEIFYQ